MRQVISRTKSIYIQLLLLLLISTVSSVTFFFVLREISGRVIENYYFDSWYFHEKNQEYIDKLEAYIDENKLSSKDTAALSTWVNEQKMLVSIDIYKDDKLMYDSDYPTREIWRENINVTRYENAEFFYVDFSDGQTEVVVWARYIYRVYTLADIVILILAFALFLTILLYGVHQKMRYISLLNDEIDILKSGGLDYHVTIRGEDELAALATGLERMRESFCKSLETEARVVNENQKIVTQMSHDIRTPITSIMLYTEILKKGKYQDEAQQREYVEKIDQKARRMKQLAENLFEYSLVTGNSEITLEEAEEYDILFYDMFSETCNYLEQYGFEVQMSEKAVDGKIRVSTDYITRIMDNITSNILKYADNRYPVRIKVLSDEKEAGFSIENYISKQRNEIESTNVGIESIKTMMRKMNGRCNTRIQDDIYTIQIFFPLILG